MSIWILIVVFAAALSVVLVLDAAARWKHGSGLVLDHYERLLSDFRDRVAAHEENERAKTTKTRSPSGRSTVPAESGSNARESAGTAGD